MFNQRLLFTFFCSDFRPLVSIVWEVIHYGFILCIHTSRDSVNNVIVFGYNSKKFNFNDSQEDVSIFDCVQPKEKKKTNDL